jgi:integrase
VRAIEHLLAILDRVIRRIARRIADETGDYDAGLKTGLLFPSEAGTRPVGNDQLNDVWREVQVMAGIDRPVTVHGIRHNTESSQAGGRASTTSPGSKVCPMRW